MNLEVNVSDSFTLSDSLGRRLYATAYIYRDPACYTGAFLYNACVEVAYLQKKDRAVNLLVEIAYKRGAGGWRVYEV